MQDFEIVTQAAIHSIVGPLVTDILARDGFEEVGTLKWVRSQDAPIRQLFCFFQWKGGTVAPSWGLSLDFVPHVSGNRVRWHRTPKTAMLDLRVDSRDQSMEMPYHHGKEPITKHAPQVIPKAVALAREFWNRAQQIADLLPMFGWVRSYYASKEGLGFDNFHQHLLALAFVYSINRQHDEAMAQLTKYLTPVQRESGLEAQLRHLLIAAGAA